MRYIEIHEGRDAMQKAPHAKEMGVTAACVTRLMDGGTVPGATVYGDSWFTGIRAAVSAAKSGRHYMGC